IPHVRNENSKQQIHQRHEASFFMSKFKHEKNLIHSQTFDPGVPAWHKQVVQCLSKGKNVLYKCSMLGIFRKLAANRNLLKNLIIRDLKHRYVGSIGGFLWSVIHPIVLLISYTFIFRIF